MIYGFCIILSLFTAIAESCHEPSVQYISASNSVTVSYPAPQLSSVNFAFYRFSCQTAVLDKTDFKDVQAKRLAATGKSRAEFSIIIKPNFMFAYDKADHTTYTDPELVAHMVQPLRKSRAVQARLLKAFSL